MRIDVRRACIGAACRATFLGNSWGTGSIADDLVDCSQCLLWISAKRKTTVNSVKTQTVRQEERSKLKNSQNLIQIARNS